MWTYNYLAHFGIKGQRWGVRHGPPYPLNADKKPRNKSKVSFEAVPTPAFTKFLSKVFPGMKDNMEKDKQFSINVDGKRVGDCEIFKESKDSLNVVWVGVDKSERGKGYATATMKGIIEYAKKDKCKQVTLEVPGNSPDARHIYEKLGFKALDKISDDDDVWGGLTKMKLIL